MKWIFNLSYRKWQRLCALWLSLLLLSCHSIYDDLPPCPHGLSLRFVYDYHLERGNAFPEQVDCLTLYIYDEKGNYVETRTVTDKSLADENWRMRVDLPLGKYKLVAYGGLACAERSFAPVREPAEGTSLADLSVAMEHSGNTSDRPLHNLFYGALDVTVSGDNYREATVKMMKDTNHIRVILQQMNGEPVSDKDFSFTITDDNTLFASDNSLLPAGTVTYLPWAQGQKSVGESGAGDTPVLVAFAEFSTSRIMEVNRPRLVITNTVTGRVVVSLPLDDYLLLFKSEYYGEMGDQEFLDRESDWNMIFLLDENHTWYEAQLIVNDWVVRVNEIPFV